MSALDEIPEPSPKLLAEVSGDLRALAVERAVRLSLLALFAVAVVTGLGMRNDAANTDPLSLAVAAGYAVAGVVLFALAFGLPIPAGRRLKWAVGAGLVAGLALLTAAVVEVPGAHPFMKGAACFGTGLGIAGGVALTAIFFGRTVLRRHAPTGWLLGVASGLLALVTLQFGCVACPSSYAMSALWHGTVPLVAGLGTALVWRALTRP